MVFPVRRTAKYHPPQAEPLSGPARPWRFGDPVLGKDLHWVKVLRPAALLRQGDIGATLRETGGETFGES